MAVVGLLNLIETLTAQHRADQEEIQRLRDENNRLKGEQGKPTFKPAPPRLRRTIPRSRNGDGRRAGARAASRTASSLTGSRC